MTIFATFACVLLLTTFCSGKSVKKWEEASVDYDFKVLPSFGRVLEQAAVGSTEARPREIWVTECSEAIVGAYLTIFEGRVLSTLNTVTVASCCEACDAMETCTSWSRNRSSGACELINAQEASFAIAASDFEVGGFLGEEFEASVAPPERPVGECNPSRGVTYPNGDVLTRGSARTSLICCETCRYSYDCFSWYYNSANNRCILNRNTPASRPAASRFKGGSF